VGWPEGRELGWPEGLEGCPDGLALGDVGIHEGRPDGKPEGIAEGWAEGAVGE
jgi:hypothetical protein